MRVILEMGEIGDLLTRVGKVVQLANIVSVGAQWLVSVQDY